MNRSALIFVVLLLAFSTAHAQHKHVHGEGRLDAVFDKETLSLNLTLPLDVAAGFERAPRNEKEKAALAGAEKILADPTLWTPTPAAQCRLQSAEIEIPFLDEHDEHDGHDEHDAHHEDEHADIEAAYTFHCANPGALKSVETTLFRSMKRLYRLEAQRSGSSGQNAQRLTPKRPVLDW
ncbi:MAG: DUF2796 domain-containing protein [Candidatus Accumulibacter sp.]|jgi:hypothetical protein|nr:DUF2796 domain-containing protein [Accumulibacter sp.]